MPRHVDVAASHYNRGDGGRVQFNCSGLMKMIQFSCSGSMKMMHSGAFTTTSNRAILFSCNVFPPVLLFLLPVCLSGPGPCCGRPHRYVVVIVDRGAESDLVIRGVYM